MPVKSVVEKKKKNKEWNEARVHAVGVRRVYEE